METEDESGTLPFLDILISNEGNGHYEFNIFRKDAITNVQIKPHSSINPNIVKSVFKGFLSRAKNICSLQHLTEEIDLLVEIFTENGHDRDMLLSIVNEPYRSKQQVDQSEWPLTVKIPWIPKFGTRIRKIFKSFDVKVIFTSGPNLKSILSQHKCRLPRNSSPGVYKLICGCSSIYIGETKKRILTRMREHHKYIQNGQWTNSGAAEHAQSCGTTLKLCLPYKISIFEKFVKL